MFAGRSDATFNSHHFARLCCRANGRSFNWRYAVTTTWRCQRGAQLLGQRKSFEAPQNNPADSSIAAGKVKTHAVRIVRTVL